MPGQTSHQDVSKLQKQRAVWAQIMLLWPALSKANGKRSLSVGVKS
jgi:hypothetical protein